MTLNEIAHKIAMRVAELKAADYVQGSTYKITGKKFTELYIDAFNQAMKLLKSEWPSDDY